MRSLVNLYLTCKNSSFVCFCSSCFYPNPINMKSPSNYCWISCWLINIFVFTDLSFPLAFWPKNWVLFCFGVLAPLWNADKRLLLSSLAGLRLFSGNYKLFEQFTWVVGLVILLEDWVFFDLVLLLVPNSRDSMDELSSIIFLLLLAFKSSCLDIYAPPRLSSISKNNII